MSIKTLAELKAKFETGDLPTGADFVDLIDSFLHAQLGNFPNPLPAVSGAALLDIGGALPNPLPAIDGSLLTNINPQEYNLPAGMPVPSYATPVTFVLNDDWTVGASDVAKRVFLVGRRLETTVGGVLYYTEVLSAAFATGVTTVTLLDAMVSNQLTAVKVGVIRPVNYGGAVSQGVLNVTTEAPETNTARLATTAFVQNAVGVQAVRRWTIRTSAADNSWVAIAWSPALGLFAAVAIGTGTGNRVMTSPDGINWTIRTSAADNSWQAIAWSPALGLFAAVAYSGTGNRVMTSPDGINWTIRTSAADNNWTAIAWSPALGLFAAVAESGTGDRVMTSPDGINWTIRTSAANNTWYAIAWSEALGLFAAVAYSGTGNRVMTSPDGITWTIRTSAADSTWRGIAWSPALGLFAAVAASGTGNRVMTSPDGITWTLRTSAADNNWVAIAWSPALGLFAAVTGTGTGNRVMTSA